jgi:hypothetical protein
MKKILSIAAALVVAAAFISCGDSGDSFDGKTDTVLTIGAPSVTAKAYPGVNYIQWSVVPSASTYEIYRIGDGEANGTKLAASSITGATVSNAFEYADVASTTNVLANGKSYKYVVVAVPANAQNNTVATPAQIPSRAIYMKANQGSASVTAYVPAAGTAITEFTDSYTKNFLKKYTDAGTDVAKLKKIGAEVKIVNDVTSGADLYATYPATAGFEFGVKFINKTQPEYLYESKVDSTTGVYLENYTLNAKTTLTDAGEYEAYLTVKSVSSLYPTTVTYSLGTQTVKALGETATAADQTTVVTSKFTDKDNVTITWQPSKTTAGAVFGKENYAVYRTTGTGNDGSTYVKVDGTIEDVLVAGNGTAGSDVVVSNGSASGTAYVTKQYKIVDKIGEAGNKSKYTYKIVLFAKDAEGNIEIGKTKTATVNPFTLDTTDAPNFVTTTSSDGYNALIGTTAVVSSDKTKLDNQIKIVAHAKNSKTQKLYLSYIKLDTAESSYNKTFTAFGTETEMKNNNDIRDDVFVEYIDTSDATKFGTGAYLFKLTAKETGKDEISVYTTVVVSKGSVATDNLTLTRYNATDGKAIVKDEGENADTVGKYKYQLVILTVSKPVVKDTHSNNYYSNYVTVSSETKDITLAAKDIAASDATASSEYVASGLTGSGTAASITYPFAFVTDVKGETGATGSTEVRKTWYVKKILVADESKYGFSNSSVSASWLK